MKKKVLIFASVVVILLVSFIAIDHFTNDPKKNAYERAMSLPVPTGSVENFEGYTREIIELYDSKSKELRPLTDDEDKKVKKYFEEYLRNPRLSDEQSDLQAKISILENAYWMYSINKDSKEPKDVKTSNQAITQFFSYLETLKSISLQ
ncbi:hypothetical protein NST48_12740 [Paenibacillus sp. FSL M7-0547]|uniref:hypothetical protein n=1 Tax=Paenibacillus sp. FSL M7-0547 TaxID=2954755 RepID=UPI0030FC9EBB